MSSIDKKDKEEDKQQVDKEPNFDKTETSEIGKENKVDEKTIEIYRSLFE